jgi:RNA polymerase sigma-70 factor, ECF subfamily
MVAFRLLRDAHAPCILLVRLRERRRPRCCWIILVPAQLVATRPPEKEVINQAELVRAVLAGERWAANSLYELLYPSIARALQRVLQRPGSDYDDLVQSSFERVLRVLQAQGGEHVMNLRAWASGIATHVALDAMRFRIRERGLFRQDDSGESAGLELVGSNNAERRLEARRQLAVVQDVLSRMKRSLAEAVVLHDMVGHDLAETAALTNVSVAAAQSRLVRGRKELLHRVEQRLSRGSA